MQKYDVVETEIFEKTLEDTIDYLWTKYKNDQAIEHLVVGILDAKAKLAYTASLQPYYNVENGEQYIQVDKMNYIIIFILDKNSYTVNLVRLSHFLQNR